MKKKLILPIVLIIFVLLFVIFVNGIKVVSPATVFSTKYYKTAEEAFWADYSPSAYDLSQGYNLEEIEQLDVVMLDDNNALFVGKSYDKTIIASMFVKKGKYLLTTDIFIYTPSDITEFSDELLHNVNMYNANGKSIDPKKFALSNMEVNNEKFYSVKINASVSLYVVIKK